ncbi:hypothetical protein OEG84_11560 [Hoeflea sp. G2-23]|uniref:Uncharacterized protein n=1 Tax=Hoeflea algicola TaxID=2983763 RepID=A0ABT3Z993_9HYPH|nr:hypothetical protein [Hoeflea algicola]MCY0148330.1 hypothetical protein [Hoeflea algicola]
MTTVPTDTPEIQPEDDLFQRDTRPDFADALAYMLSTPGHPEAKRHFFALDFSEDTRWKGQAQQATSVLSMIHAMIGELFGPVASIESEEAVLLRGPEAKHTGEAILAALQRVSDALAAKA